MRLTRTSALSSELGKAYLSGNPFFRYTLPSTLALSVGFLARAQAAPALPNLPADYDVSFLAASPSGAGTAQVSFNTQANAQGYTLLLQPADMKLLRRDADGEETLAVAPGAGLQNARQNPVKIVIQRRKGRINVLEDHRLAFTVEDNLFNGGDGDSTLAGDATITDLKAQPREALYFTDDFMRQPTEQGDWTYDRGQWRIQTVGNIKWGANPFSLVSTPNPAALASAGYPFWSDYSFRVAVKGSPGTSFGICVNLQDKDNYYLLRWKAGAGSDLELQRVQDGKATTLGTVAGGFIPNQWYALGLRTSGGRLVAEVDHQDVMSVRDMTFGAGRVGLYSEGKDTSTPVWFDSVIAQPSGYLADSFGDSSAHHWQIEGEKALGGSPDWQNYTVTAEVAGTNKVAGIPFHYHDAQNYDVVAWDPKAVRLFAVIKGERTLLASSEGGLPPGSFHTVQAGAQDGYLWGMVDGKKVVEGLDTSLGSGQVGFQPAVGGGKFFRSVDVRVDEKPEPTDTLTDEFTQFAHHFDMRDWAGPLHAWEPGSFGKENGIWHKGNLYGNTTFSIPLNAKVRQNGQFALVLNGDGKTSTSGYELDYTAAGNGAISLQLLRQGQLVADGQCKVSTGADPVMLEARRQGPFVSVVVGSETVLNYQDPEPLDGYRQSLPADFAPNAGGRTRYGLIQRGDTQLDVPLIKVTNRNVYSETFHLAPVNWRSQSGTWDVTSRWSCTPGWTWYGGKGTSYSANWHKAPLWGDQSIDYYAAAMMSPFPPAATELWQDLNCSFCSDGVNLFSGYTLVVGGWGNTASRLYRKGHMVAENTTFHFPPAGVAHRMWYDVHIEKEGSHIRVVLSTVDTSQQHQVYPLFEWTDPDPLAGGFTGFWTYNNGMMIARTVLSAENKASEPLYTARPTWLTQQPATTPYPQTPEAGPAAVALLPSTEPTLPVFNVPYVAPPSSPTPPPGILVASLPDADSAPQPITNSIPELGNTGSTLVTSASPGSLNAAVLPDVTAAALEPAVHSSKHHHPRVASFSGSIPLTVSSGQPAAGAGQNTGPATPPSIHPAIQPSTSPVPPAPEAITVAGQPVELQAQNLAMTVEPGGILSNIRFKGREVVRQVLLDIRSAEWHQVKLTADNTKVQVVKGDQPTVTIQFQVHQPELNLTISGKETVRIMPGDVLRVEAALEPGSSFESKRVSINLVVPAGDYAGKQARTTTAGTDKTLTIPTQALFPIQMAENITHLALPDPGIDVRPIEGTGVFEDLRHYSIDEFWFEQQAQYPYPHVQQGNRKHLGMDVHFGSP